jgi:hypothetical protein
VLISRYPLEAAHEWIDANEKEIVERKRRKLSRRIELNGSHIGIGPMKRPNLYEKLQAKFAKPTPSVYTLKTFERRRIYEF